MQCTLSTYEKRGPQGRVFQNRVRSNRTQFFSLSTILFAEIHGIMRAQLLTDHLDRMLGIQATTSRHGRIVAATFLNEHLGVLTGLDTLQCIAHGFTGLLVDDLRAGDILTILRVVGDGVVHVGDAAFVHQVNNQLELVQTLEVGHFRRITGFGQCFETGLDQLNRTTTQHRLLTEQIGFGLVLEGGFDDAGTAAADAAGVGQSDVLGVAGSVLEDGDQVRNTAAIGELGATVWPGALGAIMMTSRSLRGTIWL